MDKEDLRRFLVDANSAGYAGGDEKQWTRQPDGSTTIRYEKGDWLSDDNFFGGEPYGGRTVVSHQGVPVWMIVYYGWVAERLDADQVYAVLRRALMSMPEDHPFRGPKSFSEGEYAYENSWDGTVEKFTGVEKITARGRLIYEASYAGGLVDQRRRQEVTT